MTCENFYEPRGLRVRMLNALFMRRRFARVRNDILLGLRAFVERRGALDSAEA